MEVKKQRLYRLNESINEFSKKSNEKLRGEIVEVLVEGESKNNPDVLSGRTRTNKMIHFVGSIDSVGKLVHVKITEPQTWVLKGELVPEPVASA
jgi:tRNA-2-methylthio-N6-dimethylallyladenosine synthase